MKEITSTCEKKFLLQLSKFKRLDGRDFKEGREVSIIFGLDRGSCMVTQGDTKVFTQISCEIAEPKAVRPTEGLLFINLELSPMAAPKIEAGRLPDFGIEISRLLDRCIKDSRCIDLESLCIVAGEKVWAIRTFVHVLNHDGNILECATTSVIAALLHFRRPSVTVIGTEVTVHSVEECNPVPLNLHHMPLCIKFAFFDNGEKILIDPIEIEERISDGAMVVGINAHQEICTLHLSGPLLVTKDIVMKCAHMAVIRAQEITDCIKKSLDIENQKRESNEEVGFASKLRSDSILVAKRLPQPVVIEDERPSINVTFEVQVSENVGVDMIHRLGPGTAVIGEGGPSAWSYNELTNNIENQLSNVSIKGELCEESAEGKDSITGEICEESAEGKDSESNSEEEEMVNTLHPEHLENPVKIESDIKKEPKSDSDESDNDNFSHQTFSRGWYSKNAFM